MHHCGSSTGKVPGWWNFCARLFTVRDEPGVAAAVQVLGVPAPRDVGLVLERDADGEAVELDVAGAGQVEDVLVSVVQEALALDRFVVAG